MEFKTVEWRWKFRTLENFGGTTARTQFFSSREHELLLEICSRRELLACVFCCQFSNVGCHEDTIHRRFISNEWFLCSFGRKDISSCKRTGNWYGEQPHRFVKRLPIAAHMEWYTGIQNHFFCLLVTSQSIVTKTQIIWFLNNFTSSEFHYNFIICATFSDTGKTIFNTLNTVGSLGWPLMTCRITTLTAYV